MTAKRPTPKKQAPAPTARERIYDAEIAPLMKRIVETCKAHDIPIIAAFDLDGPENRGLKCITHIAPDGPAEFNSAHTLIREGYFAFTHSCRKATTA
jgi:hypothetical protein